MNDPRRKDPFAELYGDFSDRLHGDRWRPDVDVFETESDLVVRVELSGVRREDVRVTVDGDVLRICGSRASQESGVERLHQMEITSGPFDRRLVLPVATDRDRVSAHLADGVLTVTLAKRGPARRTVEVERE